MKRNITRRIISFVSKYIWLFCVLLILLEVGSTLYVAYNLVKQTSHGMIESVNGEIYARVKGTLQLIDGISKDEKITDDNVSMFERAKSLTPYKDSYNLFMIALTNENIDVVSTNTEDPTAKLKNLAYRDYMQEMYKTGNYQITDAFPAGADGTTMNYTIAVPIIKDNIVAGSVFGAIYFKDIENIILKNGDNVNNFFLFGQNDTVMASEKSEDFGKSFLDIFPGILENNKGIEQINLGLSENKPTNFWSHNDHGICYINTMPIPNTNWNIAQEIHFTPVLISLLPSFLLKIVFYIFLSVIVFIFGQKYLRKQLEDITHLFERITSMQKEIFQSEKTDIDELLKITRQGLTDQLTGLPTRSVLINKVSSYINNVDTMGAVFFIDLDDLKKINDLFGHDMGDLALLHFSAVIKKYENKFKALSSRYGGDEFVLIINNVTIDDITKIANDLCADFRKKITLQGKIVNIHGSIGISCFPKDSKLFEELISMADFALYDSKRQGKNQWSFFDKN